MGEDRHGQAIPSFAREVFSRAFCFLRGKEEWKPGKLEDSTFRPFVLCVPSAAIPERGLAAKRHKRHRKGLRGTHA
jgi:hypothetical protein